MTQTRTKNHPDWICDDCGFRLGRWHQGDIYSGPEQHCATYHIGKCDVCGSNDIAVTEPRDFGYLVEW